MYTESTDEGDGQTWLECCKCSKWNHPQCEMLRCDGANVEMINAADRAINGDGDELDYWCLKCRKSAQYKEVHSKCKPKPANKTPRNGGKKAV